MTLKDLIFAIIAAIIPVIGSYLTVVIQKHANISKLTNALPMLAKQAVILSYQLGMKDEITNAVKKSQAIEYVSQQLDKLGVTKANEALIVNAVQLAYQEAKAAGLFADATQPVAPVKTPEKTTQAGK